MDEPLIVDMLNPNLKIVPTPTTNKEEGNSEVAVEKFYFRRCKRKSSGLTNMDSLPDELVFNILLHLPAQDIYAATVLVCKKWYKMIHSPNFIYKHLRHSTPGLLIQYHPKFENALFMAMRRGRVEVYKFRSKLRVIAQGSCNGLIVESNCNSPLYIANPATNKRFLLPPCLHVKAPFHRCGLAYDPSSMKYKVVMAQDLESSFSIQDCAIFTVEVDKTWRYIDTQHLSRRSRQLLCSIPMTTEGFLHWTDRTGTHVHVLTLNVETEIITQTPIPEGYGQSWKYYLSTGRSITLFIVCGDYSWEFWSMKPENGEWTKLPKIDLEARKGKFEHLITESPYRVLHRLRPVGWLNEEVLVFHSPPSRVCILYNVRTQEIDLFDLNCDSDWFWFNVHKNSLLCL